MLEAMLKVGKHLDVYTTIKVGKHHDVSIDRPCVHHKTRERQEQSNQLHPHTQKATLHANDGPNRAMVHCRWTALLPTEERRHRGFVDDVFESARHLFLLPLREI